MSVRFDYGQIPFTPINVVREIASLKDMTLVTISKFDGGIDIKSESISVDSERLTDSETMVGYVSESQRKIFQITSTAVVSAAGSFDVRSLGYLQLYASLCLSTQMEDFDNAVAQMRNLIDALTATRNPDGELVVAGYDRKQQDFRIRSIKIDGGGIAEQEHDYYHILGGKSLVDLMLKAGDIPDLGENAKERTQEYINLASDSIFLRASLEEKKLIAKYPALPWRIGGNIQKWVITSSGASEEDSELPALAVRIKPGDVLSSAYKELPPEAYNRFMAEHEDEIKKRLEKWDKSLRANDRNTNAQEALDALMRRAAQPPQPNRGIQASSDDYTDRQTHSDNSEGTSD